MAPTEPFRRSQLNHTQDLHKHLCKALARADEFHGEPYKTWCPKSRQPAAARLRRTTHTDVLEPLGTWQATFWNTHAVLPFGHSDERCGALRDVDGRRSSDGVGRCGRCLASPHRGSAVMTA